MKIVEADHKEAVLLLAHGTPDVLGEMDEYLKRVTGGRGVPSHVVHELQQRYAGIGLGDTPSAEGPRRAFDRQMGVQRHQGVTRPTQNDGARQDTVQELFYRCRTHRLTRYKFRAKPTGLCRE